MRIYYGNPENDGTLKQFYKFVPSGENNYSYEYYYISPVGPRKTVVNCTNAAPGSSIYTACPNMSTVSDESVTTEAWNAALTSLTLKKTKRTYYTTAEAAAHVNHSNHSRVIFTFK